MTAHKVMLLGEIGVGKSSIVRRLVHDRFELSYKPTIGVDIYRYDVPQAPGRPARSLIIWDTDGNFGDAIFRHVYIKEAAACLIVGDVSRPGTLDSMVRLGEGFVDALPGRHCTYVVNKIDLMCAMDKPALPQGLLRPRVELARTSARTGCNVREAFLGALAAIDRRGL